MGNATKQYKHDSHDIESICALSEADIVKFQKRLKDIRKGHRLIQTKFGDLFGVNLNYVWKMENGEIPLSECSDTIDKICKYFRVNSDWLFTGLGKRYAKDDINDDVDVELVELVEDNDLSVFPPDFANPEPDPDTASSEDDDLPLILSDLINPEPEPNTVLSEEAEDLPLILPDPFNSEPDHDANSLEEDDELLDQGEFDNEDFDDLLNIKIFNNLPELSDDNYLLDNIDLSNNHKLKDPAPLPVEPTHVDVVAESTVLCEQTILVGGIEKIMIDDIYASIKTMVDPTFKNEDDKIYYLEALSNIMSTLDLIMKLKQFDTSSEEDKKQTLLKQLAKRLEISILHC